MVSAMKDNIAISDQVYLLDYAKNAKIANGTTIVIRGLETLVPKIPTIAENVWTDTLTYWPVMEAKLNGALDIMIASKRLHQDFPNLKAVQTLAPINWSW